MVYLSHTQLLRGTYSLGLLDLTSVKCVLHFCIPFDRFASVPVYRRADADVFNFTSRIFLASQISHLISLLDMSYTSTLIFADLILHLLLALNKHHDLSHHLSYLWENPAFSGRKPVQPRRNNFRKVVIDARSAKSCSNTRSHIVLLLPTRSTHIEMSRLFYPINSQPIRSPRCGVPKTELSPPCLF